jgi:hypothetical protein
VGNIRLGEEYFSKSSLRTVIFDSKDKENVICKIVSEQFAYKRRHHTQPMSKVPYVKAPLDLALAEWRREVIAGRSRATWSSGSETAASAGAAAERHR